MKKIRPMLEAGSASILVFALLTSFVFLLYMKSMELLENEIKRGLKSSAAAAATTIDGDQHKIFDADTSRDDPLYINAIMPLEKIRRATSDIRYIYTNILVENSIYFILNPSPQNKLDGVEPLAPALMELYDDPASDLVTALNNNVITVSEEYYQDKWGKFYSAYAPFYDKNGTLVGTLGMDLEISGFEERVRSLKMLFEKTFIIVIFISLLVGVVIYLSRKFSLCLQDELNSNTRILKDLDCFYTYRLQEMYDFFVESSNNTNICGKFHESVKFAKEYYSCFLRGDIKNMNEEYLSLIDIPKSIKIRGVGILFELKKFSKDVLPNGCKISAEAIINVNRIIQKLIEIDNIEGDITVSLVNIKEQAHKITIEFHISVSKTIKDLISCLNLVQNLSSTDDQIRNRMQLICAVSQLLKCDGYIYTFFENDSPRVSIGVEAIKN